MARHFFTSSVHRGSQFLHTSKMAISPVTLSLQLVCLVIILGAFSPTIANPNTDIPDMPTGYVFDRTLNVAFKVHAERRTWAAAKKICEDEGAILAIVDTMEQIRYLSGKKPENNFYAWVGMSRQSPTVPWSTLKGNTMTSIPWAPTKPAGSHNCMAIRGCFRGLSNENCNTSLGFICEMARGVLIAQ